MAGQAEGLLSAGAETLKSDAKPAALKTSLARPPKPPDAARALSPAFERAQMNAS
jgi:hypothetical protein